MGHGAAVLVLVCWGAFGVVWLAGGLYNLARGPRTRRRTHDRPWMFWTVIVAAWLLTLRVPGVRDAALWRSPALGLLGSGLLIAGTAFTLWARVVLGRMWSSAPSVKDHHELQTHGPYAVTRHPIYTGMLAMAVGSVLMAGRAWEVFAFALFLAYILSKIRAEERLMEETFGAQYEAYRAQVPTLIPGVRRT